MLISCRRDANNNIILKFMNSWSPTWNVDGTFEISWDVFIERQFRFEVFNIFWTEADLSETEKNAYRDFVARAGNNIGHDVFPAEPDRLHYVCPTCREQVIMLTDYFLS